MSGKLSFQLEVLGVEQAAAKLKDLDKLTSSLGNKKGITVNDLFKATAGNFSQATISKNKALFEQLGKQAGQSFDKGFKGAAPPIISEFLANRKSNILAGGISTLAGNPYLAARSFMAAFGGGKGGGGGLGMFGLGAGSGGNFLPAAGALAAVQAAAKALQLVMEGLRLAFDQLKDAVKRGSELFTASRRIGTGQFQLAQARNVGGLLGLGESEIDAMLLKGEFGARRGGGTTTKPGTSSRRGSAMEFMGEIFGATGPSQMGNMQQLINSEKDLLMVRKDAFLPTVALASTSRALWEVDEKFQTVLLDIKGIFSDLADLMSTNLKLGLQAVDFVLKDLLNTLNLFVLLEQKLGITSSLGDSPIKALAGQRIPVNQFERIGFIFGGGKFGTSSNPADKTANNTAKMVGLLTDIKNAIKSPSGGTGSLLQSPEETRLLNPKLFGGSLEVGQNP